MSQSRRGFIAATGAAAVAVPVAFASGAQASTQTRPAFSRSQFLKLFQSLPGTVGLRVYAPAANGDSGLDIGLNNAQQLFVGSAFKTYVLAETLRGLDSPQVVAKLSSRQLDLNASVWSGDSATFNPPNLIGQVSQRTALEAMINHSDNTGTDMSIKAVGIQNVRNFIRTAGLKHTLVPDSTRAFFGYLLGVKDYKNFTWDQLQAAANDPIVNHPLNQTQTLAGSADDFISYYSRALRGGFFKHPETLSEFRRILTFGDAIYLVPLPLGVSAFVKGGSIDTEGFHALSVPGGMLFDDRWVFFCFTLNWNAKAVTDPATVQKFAAATSAGLAMVKKALERR
jgi:beta-lactamase class A